MQPKINQALKQKRCLIVAEVAQTHDGSVSLAHDFIDAIAKAGADAVKFQTHIAEAESSPYEPWRIHFSKKDKTRFDYWKRMEFKREDWIKLKKHAERVGLIFLSSPFSLEAVKLLDEIGMPAWKIPSGEVTNKILLKEIAKKRKPVFLSSGMSPLKELEKTVQFLKKYKVPLAVFQCTSSYPTPPEKVGLNLIPDFKKRFRCAVGLSDHSGTIFSALAARTLGATFIEVHVAFNRKMFGPDVSSSITFEKLQQLVQGVRVIETSLNHPVDKRNLDKYYKKMRKIFTKSIFAAKDLRPGTVLQMKHLAFKKPGTGILVEKVDDVLGKRLLKAVNKGEFIDAKNLKK